MRALNQKTLQAIIVAGLMAPSVAIGAQAREWQLVDSSGWLFDPKNVTTEQKDGVVNLEPRMVFQLRQEDASGKKTAPTAEPTNTLYIGCETRTYRLWDIATSTEQGPLPTNMFSVAEALEGYCDRVGKVPEEKRPGAAGR